MSNLQCCQIWRFIANLATFELHLLLFLGARDFPFLATFLATFEFVPETANGGNEKQINQLIFEQDSFNKASLTGKCTFIYDIDRKEI